MALGAGEIILIALLAFIAFGPRRKEAPRPLLRRSIITALAVAAPALVVIDQAGSALGLALHPRLWLTAAAAASTLLTLLLLRTADRWLNRKKK